MKLRLKEDPREWRKFAWASAGFLLASGLLLAWRHPHGLKPALALGSLGLCIAALGTVRPAGFRRPYRLAMTGAHYVGQVVGRILLAIIFCVGVIPSGLLLRCLGKDLLGQRRDPSKDSYWRPAPRLGPLDRLFAAVLLASSVGSAVAAESGRAWLEGEGFRYTPLSIPDSGKPGFTLLPPATTGLSFTNTLPESRHLTNQILLNGSGVAAGDVNGDGWCDLYFCRATGTNALYLNLGGWRFTEVPDAGGAGCPHWSSTGAALADLDGDGDLDLVVNTLGRGTHLFFNDGLGRFQPAPQPLNPGRGGMTAALADVDGDGYLDLYLANYRTSGLMDIPNARATFKQVGDRRVMETLEGRPTTAPDLTNRFVVGPRGDILEQGDPDILYRNNGGTNFIANEVGASGFLDESGQPFPQPLRDWGLTATFRDLDGDRRPDLYVCNDFHSEDRLWINQGAGVFRLAPAWTLRHTSMFSMAVDFTDLDRDGDDDFLVLDMMSRDHAQRMRYQRDRTPDPALVRDPMGRPQSEHNVLYLNRGDMTFAEIAHLAGLEAAEWAWSCAFLDVDLDGHEDLLVVNGMERAARDLDVIERLTAFRNEARRTDAEIFLARRMFPRLATPNLAFRNRGDLTFEETGQAWGFAEPAVSSAIALADLDNDGDPDAVVNNLNQVAGLYRNNSQAPRLVIRLSGRPPNTRGVGAHLRVTGGPVPLQTDEITAGGRYLSSDDAQLCFAVGDPPRPVTVEVLWPGGGRSLVSAANPNHLYEIREPETRPATTKTGSTPITPLFLDASALLDHRHVDEPFDDYSRQSLLPRQLSHLGPALAWGDLDRDGNDDLVVGAGRGGQLVLLRNNEGKAFARIPKDSAPSSRASDLHGILVVPDFRGSNTLITAVSNYENGTPAEGAILRFDLLTGSQESLLPASESTPGPIAAADVDADGDLDLFVGGRVIPGQYPAPATSHLLVQNQGRFRPDPDGAAMFPKLGLVSGAVFSDVDGDGDPDLILACEWNPLRLFLNTRGRFTEATSAWRLDACPGWWNSIATGDFNADGRPDLVAGNWGRNTAYQAHRNHPLRIHYADVDQDSFLDLIESHYDQASGLWVPDRQLTDLAKALPPLREQFRTHRAFGKATIEDVLGAAQTPFARLEVTWLDTTIFLNRGQYFDPHPLPIEAQMAPTFGLAVGDLDGDGHQDLVLAQNFFGVQPRQTRLDAGRSLLLRGNGQGGFQPLSAQESGLTLWGEGRAAALADFNRDGRLDLAIAQNGYSTALLRNQRGKPGLRVRLHGPPGNPEAIGSAARLISSTGTGPLHEWQLGAGYWSQDSATKVLTAAGSPTKVWVRWQDGQIQEFELPPDIGSRRIDIHPTRGLSLEP